MFKHFLIILKGTFWRYTVHFIINICLMIYVLFRTEGMRGFFKGMFYPVITAGAVNSLFFGVYGVTLNQYKVLLIHLKSL